MPFETGDLVKYVGMIVRFHERQLSNGAESFVVQANHRLGTDSKAFAGVRHVHDAVPWALDRRGEVALVEDGQFKSSLQSLIVSNHCQPLCRRTNLKNSVEAARSKHSVYDFAHVEVDNF